MWSLDSLSQALDKAGVAKDQYSLSIDNGASVWVLCQGADSKWEIFLDEKGKQNLHVFESESEACLRFFEIMTGSKWAKKEP